jgi:hypothetical protein
MVVSRDVSGKVLSRYGELSWDWSPYHSRGVKSNFHFCFWGNNPRTSDIDALVSELKWIMYLIIWRKDGALLSYQTLYHYLKLGRSLARYCNRHSISLTNLLSSKDRLIDFVISEQNKSLSKTLSGLVTILAKLGEDKVGFLVPGDSVNKQLRKLMKQYGRIIGQHPPIPTRIYSLIIEELVAQISEFEGVERQFLQAIQIVLGDPFTGLGEERQLFLAKERGVVRNQGWLTFDCLIDQYGIRDYLHVRGLDRSIKGLSKALVGVQLAARLTVQLFTGMRADEVAALTTQCLKEEQRGGRTHFVIYGVTTKLNNGQCKVAQWVTSSEGAKAIKLAARIADFVVKVGKFHISKSGEIPLFISVGYLGLLGSNCVPHSPQLVAPKLDLNNASWLRIRVQPILREEDLRELEQIDPHRAWRSEGQFELGRPWVLTSHQLRRSLALYAQRSGLVSLPSLRRQLQHITEEMSRYYARGSAFAKNFIGNDKTHFGYEWQEVQPFSSALSYIFNVLLSDDVLFGGHANWLDHRFHKKDGYIFMDREATIARFKKGELAYLETPLGGCVNTEGCDQVALRWLNVDCLSGCKNFIGNLSKLNRVIVAQSKLLSALDPSSM